jgi:hypothetical protein
MQAQLPSTIRKLYLPLIPIKMNTQSSHQLSPAAVAAASLPVQPLPRVVHDMFTTASASSSIALPSTSFIPVCSEFLSGPASDPDWFTGSTSRSPSPPVPSQRRLPLRIASSWQRASIAVNHVPAAEPFLCHDNIRDWKAWLTEKVNEHLETLEDQPSVYIQASSIASGGVLLWRYLQSALGDSEDVEV